MDSFKDRTVNYSSRRSDGPTAKSVCQLCLYAATAAPPRVIDRDIPNDNIKEFVWSARVTEK